MASKNSSPDRLSDRKESTLDTSHAEKNGTLHTEHAPIPEDLSKRLDRKFDIHIVPWLFVLWLLAFIDRSNIGNARIDGLTEELGLSSMQFSTALAIFYVPYILYDIPSNWVLTKIKAGIYLPLLVVIWGIISLCIGFAKTYEGLLAARFFLGWAEAGLLGGMIIYLAMFYRRYELMYRIGLFYCAAPLAGAFGGLLATGLAQIHTSRYQGWSFIFFVEGAITVVVGIVAMFFLPNTPNHAKFLTDEEKRWANARMREDSQGTSGKSDMGEERFDWYWVKKAIFNWETAILSLNFFAIITPIYSFSLFLPTIIRGIGYSQVTAQLFTVPPNMGGFFSVLLVCWLSDKYKQRGIFMVGGQVLAIVGYIMLISSNRGLVQYGGTFLVAAGIFPCSPLVMGWLANNLTPHYVRATGTGFQIMVANMAAFIATFTYRTEDGPRFFAGHGINLGVLALALTLTIINLLYVTTENRKRDQGKRNYRLEEYKGREDRLGYRHPNFRYTR